MNELIKVTQNEDRITVSARELHEFLELTERFSAWFERMLKYGFEETIDYIGCKVFNTLAKQELQDYQLTIEMAKEISMIQRNEKGKLARGYFITCEKQLKEKTGLLPTNPRDILKLIVQANEEVDKKVDTLRNDVEDRFEDMPLFNIECHELQKAVKRRGTEILGGYRSPAYNDRSLRQRVYEDINRQVKREFGVSSYKAIKREYYQSSKEIVEKYNAPVILKDEIQRMNNQQFMDL